MMISNSKRFFESEGINLSRENAAGWANAGLCPFHEDRRSGNFRVNALSGAFKCFACGAKGGDLIDYLRLRYGLNFKQAKDRLVERGNIPHGN